MRLFGRFGKRRKPISSLFPLLFSICAAFLTFPIEIPKKLLYDKENHVNQPGFSSKKLGRRCPGAGIREAADMDRNACMQAGIRYDEGLARFMGNAALYQTFLKKFPADPGFSALGDALRAGDAEAAFQAAHSLKGVSGNLSLNDLYENTIPLVEALRGRADLAKARALYPAVEEAYRRASAFIASL